MAEAAGLAIGSVAIASLFTTCIELMECFELCRSYEYDYKMACLKLSLLRSRLDSCWLTTQSKGNSCQCSEEEIWYPSIPNNGVIRQSLRGIADILNNADLLQDKYCLRARESRNKIAISNGHNITPSTYRNREASILARVRSTRVTFIRRSTTWAIRDKQKFDILIDDLGFFVTNLEAVSLPLTRFPPSVIHGKIRIDTSQSIRTMSMQPTPPASPGVASVAKTHDGQQPRAEVPTISISATEAGHEFSVERVEVRAKAISGSIGGVVLQPAPAGQIARYRVGVATDDAKVVCGAMSEQAANDFFRK